MAIDFRTVAKKLRKSALVRKLRKEAPHVGERARGLVIALLPAPLTSRPPRASFLPPPEPRPGNGTATDGASVDLAVGLASHLGQIVHKRVGQLSQTIDFADQDDPVEALHDLRVASRRLRAFVTLFEPLLDPHITAHVGKALRRVTRAAGELRDIDVQMKLIEERVAVQTTDVARGALEHLLESVRDRRGNVQRDAQRKLRKVRRNDVNVGVAAALGEVVARLPASPAATAEFAWTLLEPILDDVEANERDVGEDSPPQALHELRISIKKLRYALELVAPVLGVEQRELIKRAESLQELLGTYHDLNVIAGLMEAERSKLEKNGRKSLPFGLTVLRGELEGEERALVREFETKRAPPGYFRDRIRAALAKA